MPAPLLQLSGITKSFGTTRALSDVAIGLAAGEVHALVGENGYLRESYERNVGMIAALRTHLAVKPLHTKMSFQEHRTMLEAIRNRDVAATLAILDVHIGRTRETYSAEIEDIAAADKEITEAS